MKTTLLITATFSILTGCSGVNQENLVMNPGFETGTGEEPPAWGKLISKNVQSWKTGVSNDEFHSGTASYEISRIWAYPWQQAGFRSAQPVSIDPLKDYILSFWYKTRGIDEYPLALVSQFKVRCGKSPEVNYRKSISNSDEWKQYFILLDNIPSDAVNLDIIFYCWIRTKGSIWIDDIEFREAAGSDIAAFEKWRRQPDAVPLGKSSQGKFTANGFFRVEKDETRWWFVDPEGNPEWALATVGEIPSNSSKSADAGRFRDLYGTTRDESAKRIYEILMNDCGFNFFAGWTSRELAAISASRFDAGEPYIPYTQVMNLSNAGDLKSAYAKDRNDNLLNKSGHWVVDPYNPEWRKMAEEKTKKMISEYEGKPWFAGWYIDNEMDYDDLFRFIWADYSSKEFIKALKTKYKTIADLNKAWSSSFTTCNYQKFEDISEDKPEPKDWDDPSWPDFVAFERQMMGEYINFTYNLVKGLDPDHLVISNRLHLGPMPHIWRTIDLWGKYDIICMNIYSDNNLIGFNPGEIEVMRKLHEGTGRPVIIGEWSVPAIDSKLYEFGVDSVGRPLDWSWPQVVRTQQERGEVYSKCVKQLSSLDFIVGVGWFKTTDVNSRERRANRGLLNGQFELYSDLTDAMKQANSYIKKEMGLSF